LTAAASRFSEFNGSSAAAAGVRVSVLCREVIRMPSLDQKGKYGKTFLPAPPEIQRRHWERLHPMAPERFAEKLCARSRRIRRLSSCRLGGRSPGGSIACRSRFPKPPPGLFSAAPLGLRSLRTVPFATRHFVLATHTRHYLRQPSHCGFL